MWPEFWSCLLPQSPHCLWNDLKCVEWDVTPCLIQSSSELLPFQSLVTYQKSKMNVLSTVDWPVSSPYVIQFGPHCFENHLGVWLLIEKFARKICGIRCCERLAGWTVSSGNAALIATFFVRLLCHILCIVPCIICGSLVVLLNILIMLMMTVMTTMLMRLIALVLRIVSAQMWAGRSQKELYKPRNNFFICRSFCALTRLQQIHHLFHGLYSSFSYCNNPLRDKCVWLVHVPQYSTVSDAGCCCNYYLWTPAAAAHVTAERLCTTETVAKVIETTCWL